MTMFVNSVFTRLFSSNSDEFSALFSNIAPSTTISRFKVAICQKYIIDNLSHVTCRPKPQARAQPRAVRAARRNSDFEEKPPPLSNSGPASVSVASRHSLPSSSDFLRLMEKDLGSSRSAAALATSFRIKFEFLVAYAILQAAVDEKDTEWQGLLRDGRLQKTLDIAFGHGNTRIGHMYMECSLGVIAI